jgi:ParB family chromosome partitioning protein
MPLCQQFQIEPKLSGERSNAEMAEKTGESTAQIKRFIRLTYLIPKLLDAVDSGELAMTPAVELSYIRTEDDATPQVNIYDICYAKSVFPSIRQAKELRELYESGVDWTMESISDVLRDGESPKEKSFVFKKDEIRRHFYPTAPHDKIHDALKKLCADYERRAKRAEKAKGISAENYLDMFIGAAADEEDDDEADRIAGTA